MIDRYISLVWASRRIDHLNPSSFSLSRFRPSLSQISTTKQTDPRSHQDSSLSGPIFRPSNLLSISTQR